MVLRRSRWLENKNLIILIYTKIIIIKFCLLKDYNCTFEDNSFIKFEFFNWCYKELKQ